jgi:hypothetical protein
MLRLQLFEFCKNKMTFFYVSTTLARLKKWTEDNGLTTNESKTTYEVASQFQCFAGSKKKIIIIIKGIRPRVERQCSVPGPGVASVPAQERT